MITEKRIEEMVRIAEEPSRDPGNGRLRIALKDAIAEIKELQIRLSRHCIPDENGKCPHGL